jgi:hypothetical protein
MLAEPCELYVIEEGLYKCVYRYAQEIGLRFGHDLHCGDVIMIIDDFKYLTSKSMRYVMTSKGVFIIFIQDLPQVAISMG